MAEVKRQPYRETLADGSTRVTFDDEHSHADIIRYIMDDGLNAGDIFALANIEKRERDKNKA